MRPWTMAGIVFACTFGGALVGMALRHSLPATHLGADSEAMVRLAMGLIATMAALVLGLLTASAKTTFDTQDGDVRQSAADILMLDRVVAQYGPETAPLRDGIRDALARRIDRTWPDDGERVGSLDTSQPTLQLPMLLILVSWITVIFLSFGLYAPRNPTVAGFLGMATLSVAGSVFLILEMGHPFEGSIRISSARCATRSLTSTSSQRARAPRGALTS